MDDFHDKLQTALDATRDARPPQPVVPRPVPPAVGVLPPADTAVDAEHLQRVYDALRPPTENFELHPKLAQQFRRRDEMFAGGDIDWSLAEALAFGTLLTEGTSIRLSGQDTRRGTFSQRHSTVVDHRTGAEYQPLDALGDSRTHAWIYDSLLSEYAALGFEYGYAVVNKDALVIWEAQFGDFMNGGQVIIDQFVVAAEDKWGQTSGLVMLLPHGYEGQGPEHSSGRIERFLLLAAEDNIQVVNASTAAQYFHVLRRQVRRSVRKPLILFTPKSLLRAKAAHSPISDLTSGTFREVLDDPTVGDADAVARVIFCSGKVFYDAVSRRDETGAPCAVVRVEQLYPWPAQAVAETLTRYPNAREIFWLQEEPENMGAWNFVKGRFYEAHGDDYRIRRVSRTESGSPATGSAVVHAHEQRELLDRAFADL
jgi:2-oxoglutarate decarboxylase